MPDKHAPIGASKLDALALCPGLFVAVQSLQPEERNPGSAAATDGTRKHGLLEICNRRGCHPSGADAPEGYSQDERNAVAAMWSGYLSKHPARQGGPGALWQPEIWVEIGKGLGFEEGLFATTIDLAAVHKDTLEIMDAKFGYHEVSPDSLQLKAGAIGFLRALIDDTTGQFKPEYRQLKKIVLTILRPNFDDPAICATFPLEVIKEWMVEIKEVVRGALAPMAPRVPGELQCRWCSFKPQCPEHHAAAVSTMFDALSDEGPEEPGDEVAPWEIPDHPENAAFILGEDPPAPEAPGLDEVLSLADDKTSLAPAAMSADQLGRVMDRAQILKGWLSEIEGEVRKRLQTGAEVDGWKLVEGKRAREWNADEAATETALKAAGLGVKDIFKKTLLSAAALEKIPKVATSKVKREKLAELWHWKSGAPTLAPESDPRPSIQAADTMFENEEEEL